MLAASGQISGGETHLQDGALPPIAVLLEASGQRPDACGQRDHRDRLHRISGMLLGKHLAHPWLQVTGGVLQRGQVIERVGTQDCGQLASGPPAAESFHHSAQDSLSQDGRCGVGGR